MVAAKWGGLTGFLRFRRTAVLEARKIRPDEEGK
jgi:hypothetical protein